MHIDRLQIRAFNVHLEAVLAQQKLPAKSQKAQYDLCLRWLHIARRWPICPTKLSDMKNKLYKGSNVAITKTCLCNFDPLKPYFYIVKLGFTTVYIIIISGSQNLDCGYLLEPPRRGGSNEYL